MFSWGEPAMKKILIGIAALALLVVSTATARDNAPWLKSDVTYKFVFGQGYTNLSYNPAWDLAWEGTIEGNVTGVIRWWINFGEAGYPNYVGRWEVLACLPDYPIDCAFNAQVIMAGYSAGTNFPPVDGIAEWSGKGVVTFVNPAFLQYAKWFGRRTTEGGWYNFAFDEGPPNYGEGTFMIYDRPSNKH
jgi:hypothetical protein